MREHSNHTTDTVLDRVLDFSEDKGLFDCGIIVVGLSGGPDSVALINILKELKEQNKLDCDIRAFHCNHHLRPVECDEEAEQVKLLCRDIGVELKTIDFDCSGFASANHISEETAGRLLRYEAFEQYAQALEKQLSSEVRIAVAHHKDDIAETMMMNLFRGAGLEGLVNPKARNGRIIRPLLCLTKKELVHYLELRNIPYAIDKTNLTTEGTRNTWRNDFLSGIGEYYQVEPSIPLGRTYKLLSDDLDFISEVTRESYSAARKTLNGHPIISVKACKELHPAVRSRVVRMLWQECFGNLVDFEEIHLKDCFSAMERETSGELILDMPFGRKAYRYGDILTFVTADEVAIVSCSITEELGFVTAIGPVRNVIRLADVHNGEGFTSKIPNSAIKIKALRFEKEGELEYNNLSWFCPEGAIGEDGITIGNCEGIGTAFRMKKAGAKGSKELNRLMIDLKIPESARKYVVFASCGENILWLPGYGHGVGYTDAISRSKYIESIAIDGCIPVTVLFEIEGK